MFAHHQGKELNGLLRPWGLRKPGKRESGRKDSGWGAKVHGAASLTPWAPPWEPGCPRFPAAGSLGLPWALRASTLPRTPTSVSGSGRLVLPCSPQQLCTQLSARVARALQRGLWKEGLCIQTRKLAPPPPPPAVCLLSALLAADLQKGHKLSLSGHGSVQNTAPRSCPAGGGEGCWAALWAGVEKDPWRNKGVWCPPGLVPGPLAAFPQSIITLFKRT